MKRKIVVTGASSSIGLSICEKIIKEGDNCILHCLSKRQRLMDFCNTKSVNCEAIQADFTNENDLNNFCKRLDDTDILINAAAVTKTGLLAGICDDDIDDMLNVNITALIKVCKSVIPSMMVKRKGIIVNISSVAAQRGNRGQAVYAGTKGFVESFTRSIAAEYGSRGIRVNCVAPGPIETGSLTELMDYAPNEVKKSIVCQRLGNPDDVASMVGYLCSDEAGFINGKIIAVDGGFQRGV